MRKWLIIAAGIAILVVANAGILGKERLIRDGRVVHLPLAPVDPRSLMQGDYMRLRFAAAGQALNALEHPRTSDGHLVLALDEQGAARFARIDGDEPLATNELRLRYRVRHGRMRLVTDAYFFQEGRAADFQRAAFGVFRVDDSGDALLVGLADDALTRID